MSMRYFDGLIFKKAIIAGSQKVIDAQEDLNKINVFPVPDGDTGSNMAATFQSISNGARSCEHDELPELSATMADSALNGARGNSGAILAQFFQGLSEGFSKQRKINLEQFSKTVRSAVTSSREAIANPVEGTIITVMHDWSQWIHDHWHKSRDFESLFYRSLAVAKRSLKQTTEKLEVLSKAHVVDAGAQGFVHFLQGIADCIRTGQWEELPTVAKKSFHTGTAADVLADDPDLQLTPHAESHDGEIEFQYCTECIVHGESLDLNAMRELTRDWGDSQVVVGSKSRIKLHIHTNDPQRLFKHLGQYGDILGTKADDMWAQYRACMGVHVSKKIALVTDSSCSLPQDIVAKHNIIIIPLQVIVNGQPYFDRVNISHDAFMQALKDPATTLSTSQALPVDFRHGLEKGLDQAEQVMGIFLSSGLSGTYHAVCNAAKQLDDFKGTLIDSRNVTGALGLIVQIAAEAIAAGMTFDEVKQRVERLLPKLQNFVSCRTVEYLVKGGRVSRTAGLVARALGFLPVIGVGPDGKAARLGLTWGKRRNRRKALGLARQYAEQFRYQRFIIAHADAETTANKCSKNIRKWFPDAQVSVVTASPLLVSHAGPGTLAISVLADDEPLSLQKK